MRSRAILPVLMLVILAACASGQMTSSGPGGTTTYSKFYDVGLWLDEGKLGLQVVLDHEMTSGANAAQATGVVTLYLINLESRPISIGGISVATNLGEKSLPAERSVVAAARARTKVPLGKVPISNYGTDVSVLVRYRLEPSAAQEVRLTVPRITVQQVATNFGPGGRPPYPWFSAPYYPFEPPLKFID